ncbi:MAG TPA: adenine deaminase, partial [Euryarchaeota archaeon]|nr:adenine deaminase [Euryarchaeota archaeon]
MSFKLKGNIVDVENDRIYGGHVEVDDGKIIDIIEDGDNYQHYILPGFIDSHIHVESSMLPPSLFASIAIKHGTTGVVTDPHEIANVSGLLGVKYMMSDAYSSPVRFYFTAPSCVPATPFETSGAVFGLLELEELLSRENVVALGEMMNYPGVVNGDAVVMEKLELAKKYQKPVDGHAPLLSNSDLDKYILAGIST